MGAFLVEWLTAIGFVLAESGPYLLVGFIIAGFLKVAIPERWIASKMGGNDLKSVATASLLGVPIPLCSCSVIPTATQLRRAGASKGATTSFLVSTPETGVDSIGVTWALMDPLMTIVRPLSALVTAFVAGSAVNVLTKNEDEDEDETEEDKQENGDASASGTESASSCCHPAEPEPEPVPTDEGGCCHTATEDIEANTVAATSDVAPSGNIVRRALRYAFGPLLDDLAPWFVIGFLVSGLIMVLVPSDFFAGTFANGWLAMLLMLFIGVPLYVCASASTPVAAALMAKGLEPGAALVLLLAGPATNIATILVVRDLLGKRAQWAYLGSIAVCSLALGALVNGLYPFLGLDPRAMDIDPMAMEHGPIAMLAGVGLTLLMLRSVWRAKAHHKFGAWLRRMGAPIGLDLTAGSVKFALGLVLLGSYAMTAVSVVGPGQTGFLVRFGKVLETIEEPGYRLHAPWPITHLVAVPTGRIHSLDYGFERGGTAAIPLESVDLARARAKFERLSAEAEVVTRDRYLLTISYTVHYQVTDPAQWQFNLDDGGALVGVLAESALRSAVARLESDHVLRGARDRLRQDVAARLQVQLDGLDVGASVVGIRIRDIHAPSKVHKAFRDIASAAEDRRAMRHRAQEVATMTRADALADAATTVRGAEAQALLDSARARGAAVAFELLGEAVAENPAHVGWSLWFDSCERRLAGQELFIQLSDEILVLTIEGDTPPGELLLNDMDIFRGPAPAAGPLAPLAPAGILPPPR